MPNALIYIPDISGFTEFVNNTEIDHAQHIISELLEVIIDSNTLGMSISEVEGDAVLFYKQQVIPSVVDIVNQTEKTFIAFHAHLKKYRQERVCQCGACSSAANLSLKVIVHAGEIGFTKVKDSEKPFGPTLVDAHRLLKNTIDTREYLLMTDVLVKKDISTLAGYPWIEFKSGKNEYETGSMNYTYTLLSPLHEKVKDPDPLPSPIQIKNPVKSKILINKPMYMVFELVNNLDFRLLWRKDVKELEYQKGRLNRVGTKHRCLFDNGFADFETIKNDFGEEALVYGERLTSVSMAKEISFYYILTKQDNGTSVTIEGHYQPNPIYGWLLIPFIRFRLRRISKNSLLEIKKLAEETLEIEYSSV